MRITIIELLCRTSQGTTDNEAVALVLWQWELEELRFL